MSYNAPAEGLPIALLDLPLLITDEAERSRLAVATLSRAFLDIAREHIVRSLDEIDLVIASAEVLGERLIHRCDFSLISDFRTRPGSLRQCRRELLELLGSLGHERLEIGPGIEDLLSLLGVCTRLIPVEVALVGSVGTHAGQYARLVLRIAGCGNLETGLLVRIANILAAVVASGN